MEKQLEKPEKLRVNNSQEEALRAVCDTFIPSLQSPDGDHAAFWSLKASDLNIELRLLEAFAALLPEDQQKIKLLLSLLAQPVAGWLTIGEWKSFAQLGLPEREKWLNKWQKSPIGALRQGVKAMQQLTCFLYYSDTTVADPNPTWPHIGYPGPLSPPPPKPKKLHTMRIAQPRTLYCEVVVVGSGAGGGVVAGELAKAGKDVLVVEKGHYFNESDFTQKEAEMIAATYERKGLLSTADGSMTIFAGSCLGGGTTINWSGTLKTPGYVLEEWAGQHNVPHFTSKAYAQCLDDAYHAIAANTATVPLNRQNSLLYEAGRKLGHRTKKIGQNVLPITDAAYDDRAYGYSCFGDQHNLKQGMVQAYFEKAPQENMRFLVDTEVEKVQIVQGKAVGVKAFQLQPDGQKVAVEIKADRVVVAAGSIHTPAILKRSGLRHPQIGKNLYLHPVIGVSGFYPEPVDSWWGGMMTVANDEFARMDGNFGVKLETPPTHSGLIGFSLPWQSGEQHKRMMLRARNIGSIIVLTRDKFGGQVQLNRNGQPVVHYNISPYDLNHLLKGLEETLKIQLEAGAMETFIPHQQLPVVKQGNQSDIGQMIRSLKWQPNRFPMFSAHQMGTCRMGGNAKTHPLAPNGETYEVRNLFVADASAFPSASGANPMLSIEAMALFTARQMH